MGKKSAQNQAAEQQQQDDIADLQEQQALNAQAAQRQAVPAPAGGLGSAGMDQLTQLAGLHDKGILTDDEFAAQKAKILG
jgi:hypothetical protein